jgi:hypothetical protein
VQKVQLRDVVLLGAGEIDQIMLAKIPVSQKDPRDMVHDRHARGFFVKPAGRCYFKTIAVNG